MDDLGIRKVNIDNRVQHYKLPVIGITDKRPNLPGRNRLNVIKLDGTQIFYVKE